METTRSVVKENRRTSGLRRAVFLETGADFRPRRLVKRSRPPIGAHPVEVVAVRGVEPVQLGRHQRQADARRDRLDVAHFCVRKGGVGQDHTSPLGEILEKLGRERRAVRDLGGIDRLIIADGVFRVDRLLARSPPIGPCFTRAEYDISLPAEAGKCAADRLVQSLPEAVSPRIDSARWDRAGPSSRLRSLGARKNRRR